MEHPREYFEPPQQPVEQPPVQAKTAEQPEAKPERRDLFRETMEKRHRLAMQLLYIEKLCMPEIEMDNYPTLRLPEVQARVDSIFEQSKPLFDELEAQGLLKSVEQIKEAVKRYMMQYIITRRQEEALKYRLTTDSVEWTPQNLGSYLFSQRVDKPSQGSIIAERQEGYFVIKCENKDDYLAMTGEDPNKPELHSWGRSYPNMEFPSFSVPVLIIKPPFFSTVTIHERQHFINNSILTTFNESESPSYQVNFKYPSLFEHTEFLSAFGKRELQKIKDELIARIRDGSDELQCTDFFQNEIYTNLKKPFTEQAQAEIQRIIFAARLELARLFRQVDAYFVYDGKQRGRELIVYHLIDVPFTQLPERIRAITKFYKSKLIEIEKRGPVLFAERKHEDPATEKQLRKNWRAIHNTLDDQRKLFLTGGLHYEPLIHPDDVQNRQQSLQDKLEGQLQHLRTTYKGVAN